MKKINIYTKIGRRWQSDLFSQNFRNILFNYGKNSYTYKYNKYRKIKNLNTLKKIISNNFKFVIWNNSLKREIPEPSMYDLVISHQRFFYTAKPYIIYIENGLALVNYCPENFNRINKKRIKKKVEEMNFLGFLFYSETARKSFYALFSDLFDVSKYDLGVLNIFTYDNPLITEEFIKNKYSDIKIRPIKIIFCGSQFLLKGGNELIESVIRLSKNYEIKLECITQKTTIPQNTYDKINKNSNIEITDFNLSQQEFYKKLMNSDIIVHPTFFDTHSIVLIEAMKNGLPIITTDTFANVEYVIPGKNGYLINNPFNIYDKKLLPKDKRCHGKIINEIIEYENRKINSDTVDNISKSIEKILSEIDNYHFNFNRDYSDYNIILKMDKLIKDIFTNL